MQLRTVCKLTMVGAMWFAASNADAADLGPAGGGSKDGPSAPLAEWGGFYAGVNGGGGWSYQRLADLNSGFTGVTPQGAFGGGQIGYNWQLRPGYSQSGGFGSILLGIEADIQSGLSDNSFDASGNTFRSSLDYFGTVRGRAGFATASSLYYVTAGLAYGGIKNQVDLAGVGNFSADTTATGYVVGGGIELKTGRNWSMKLEYQYIDLGTNDPTNPIHGAYSANGGKVTEDDFHTIRIGLNYHPGASYEPLK